MYVRRWETIDGLDLVSEMCPVTVLLVPSNASPRCHIEGKKIDTNTFVVYVVIRKLIWLCSCVVNTCNLHMGARNTNLVG